MSSLAAVPAKTEAKAPVLSDLDSTKLENAMLRLEVLQLHLRQREAEANALVKALERPGFRLQRLADGAWTYQPVPPSERGEHDA